LKYWYILLKKENLMACFSFQNKLYLWRKAIIFTLGMVSGPWGICRLYQHYCRDSEHPLLFFANSSCNSKTSNGRPQQHYVSQMCYIHRAARFQPTWFETYVGICRINITSSCTNQGSIKEEWIEISSHKNCLIYNNSANIFREFIRLDINRLKQVSRTCVINHRQDQTTMWIL
jgi:hypothetical protein